MPERSGRARGFPWNARAVPCVLAGAALVAFVVWQTWPLAARLRTEVSGLALLGFVHPDVYLNLWIVAWVARLVASAPTELAHLPAFHPARYTLGYSEHMLGVLPVTLPAYLATGDAVFVNQFLLLATFVLSAVSMALLAFYWTRSIPGAVVAGAFFALARWRFRSVPQIQLLATFYVPLVLLFSSRYLRRGGKANLAASGTAFLAQALCSYSQAYPLYAGCAFFWIVHARVLGAPARRLLSLFAAAAVATAVFAIASLPQIMVQRFGISDTQPAWNAAAMLEQGGGLPLTDWIDPSARLFPGYVLGGLAIAGLVLSLAVRAGDHWPVRPRALAATLLAFALPLVVLAVGPAEGGPLAWAWRIVPGLEHYRHPARFAYLAWLPLAALAAMGVALLDQAARRRGRAPAAALVAIVGVGLFAFGWTQQRARLGLRLAPVPPRPPVYDWLREHAGDGEPVLEIPAGIAAPRGFRYRADPEYLLWNFHHRRPLVNGYSGYSPLIYPLVLNLAAQLPDRDALQALARLTGVRWVIVHGGLLEPAERSRWRTPGLAESARFGEDVAYAIDSAAIDWRDLYQYVPDATTLAGTALVPLELEAEISLAAPERVEAGRSLAVHAIVRNAGTSTWPSLTPRGERRVALVWRWQGAPPHASAPSVRPALLGWENVRPMQAMPPPLVSVIARDLAPGEAIEVGAVVTSPRGAGSYDLVAEVVQGDGAATPLRVAAGAARRAVDVGPSEADRARRERRRSSRSAP